jgi:hypothetical protein
MAAAAVGDGEHLDAGHAKRHADRVGLKIVSEPPVTGALHARVQVLEERVAALEALVGATVNRFFEPPQAVALNSDAARRQQQEEGA